MHHGKQEFELRVWDIPAKKRVYGTPVFVFDPADRSNTLPADPDYETARFRWGYSPRSLQDLFTRAFTTGAKDPKRRVTEGVPVKPWWNSSNSRRRGPSSAGPLRWAPGFAAAGGLASAAWPSPCSSTALSRAARRRLAKIQRCGG